MSLKFTLFAGLELELVAGVVWEENYWLAGGWRLVLERCERKTLLSWRLMELPNTVNTRRCYYSDSDSEI